MMSSAVSLICRLEVVIKLSGSTSSICATGTLVAKNDCARIRPFKTARFLAALAVSMKNLSTPTSKACKGLSFSTAIRDDARNFSNRAVFLTSNTIPAASVGTSSMKRFEPNSNACVGSNWLPIAMLLVKRLDASTSPVKMFWIVRGPSSSTLVGSILWSCNWSIRPTLPRNGIYDVLWYEGRKIYEPKSTPHKPCLKRKTCQLTANTVKS